MTTQSEQAHPGTRKNSIIVGRTRELGILEQAFDESLLGRGGVTLIGGEIGIGKTALVETFARRAVSRGALVLSGASYDLTITPPYGPWLETTDRYREDAGLPTMPEVLKRGTGIGDLASQTALFDAVRAFLYSVAEARPLVLVLDDMHWSDPTSLDLLRYLARQLDGHRLMIVVTYRDNELTRHHRLFELLPALVREAQTVRIELRALSDSDIRSLVSARYALPPQDIDRLVAHLITHAEGNPLFTVELLRALEHESIQRERAGGLKLGDLRRVPVPTLVRQVIEGRLARLDDDARHVLEIAAVLGYQVPLDLWQRVAGIDDEQLIDVVEKASQAHLLDATSDGGGVRFVHSLTRAALYDGTLALRRRRWHRIAGEALAQAPSPDPDTVAYHLQRAGDERAADWLIRAGERAQQTYAWLNAAEHFDAAARLLLDQPGRKADRGWLIFRSAGVRLRSDPKAGIALLDESLTIASAVGDRKLAALSLSSRGLFKSFVGAVAQGIEDMRTGTDQWDALAQPDASAGDDSRQSGEGINHADRGTLILWLSIAGRYGESVEAGEPYLARVSRVDEGLRQQISPGWLDAYDGVASAYAALGQPKRAMELFEIAREAYRQIREHAMESNTIGWMLQFVIIPYQTERIAFRRQLAEDACRAWSRAIGAMPPGTDPRIQQVQVLRVDGAWDELRDLAVRGREWHSNVGRHLELMTLLGFVARHQGDPGLAWEQVREGLPYGTTTEPGDCFFHYAWELPVLAADLALDAGDLDCARGWIEMYERWLAWSGATLGRAEGELLWGRFYSLAGTFDLALERARNAMEHARNPRQPLALIAAHRLLGQITSEAPDIDTAREYLLESLNLAEACAVPFERALTLLALAEVDIIDHRSDEARDRLREARVIGASLGAKPFLIRVDSVIERLDRGSRARGVGGLTPREVDVLRLIVEGKSDREIGAELFISHNTVMRHVSNILGKFEVESRTAAAAHALRHDLV